VGSGEEPRILEDMKEKPVLRRAEMAGSTKIFSKDRRRGTVGK